MSRLVSFGARFRWAADRLGILPGSARGRAVGQTLGELTRSLPLRTEIETFWLHPEHRETPTWIEHSDINDVMLATTLLPEGFLRLASPGRVQAGGAVAESMDRSAS